MDARRNSCSSSSSEGSELNEAFFESGGELNGDLGRDDARNGFEWADCTNEVGRLILPTYPADEGPCCAKRQAKQKQGID